MLWDGAVCWHGRQQHSYYWAALQMATGQERCREKPEAANQHCGVCAAVCRELVQYKYVVINADGSVDRWQPGDNLQMEVPVAQVGCAHTAVWRTY